MKKVDVIPATGRPIVYEQAPCQLDGVITSDGQQETKEGTCRCAANPEGCCVDGVGQILPLRLKKEASSKK